MFDIVLEIIRALILLAILIFILRSDNNIRFGREGWKCIKLGFFLLFIGALADISDNFESLNWTLIMGDTPGQAVVETVIGYLGGFIFLAVGFWHWLPAVQRAGRMENNLLRAETRRKLIYENAPVGIAHGIIDGSAVARNNAFARMLGYESAKELRNITRESGDKAFIWHDKEELKAIQALNKTQDQISDREVRFNHRDGSIVWALLDFQVQRGKKGKKDYFYCFARDITQRRLAEEKLAKSEHWLKTVMNSISTGIYLVDVADRSIADINPAALDMTGYTREELIGAHCCDNLCPGRKDRCKAMESGGNLINHEAAFTRKDGTEFPALKTVVSVLLDGREYYLESFVDISEQKRVEKLKEDVDRIVQHDLRSPVVALINAANIALMEDSLQGEPREMLEAMKTQGNKILDLVGFSMALYKMEAGTFTYEPGPVDIMNILREVLADVREANRSRRISFNVLLDGREASGDAALNMPGNTLLVRSLLTNLLTNGAEATADGLSITVDIQSGDEIVLKLSNPGVVPKDIRDDFFKKYVTSGKLSGTGLGTYSAKLVTNTMSGSITMETSDEENRTTITVRLPGTPA